MFDDAIQTLIGLNWNSRYRAQRSTNAAYGRESFLAQLFRMKCSSAPLENVLPSAVWLWVGIIVCVIFDRGNSSGIQLDSGGLFVHLTRHGTIVLREATGGMVLWGKTIALWCRWTIVCSSQDCERQVRSGYERTESRLFQGFFEAGNLIDSP